MSASIKMYLLELISEFGANVIRLAISLDLFSKEHFNLILLDSSDPLSSKILLSVNTAATQAAG